MGLVTEQQVKRRQSYPGREERTYQGDLHGQGQLFEETAGNEREHAKIWFKLLEGGAIKDTLENLKAAAEGEYYEWTEMYPTFAKEAREEGFNDIAFLFEQVALIEKEHDARYKKLYENIVNNKVFKRDEQVVWVCSNCGHIVKGETPNEICPVCKHPKSYFEIQTTNY